MDTSGRNLLAVTCTSYTINKVDIVYHFNVNFGTRQSWTVNKTYDDFKAFHDVVSHKYGAANVPYFTGKVWIAPLSNKTGDKRKVKLEEYLADTLTKWPAWRPAKHAVELPHPDGVRDQFVRLNRHIFEFIEVEDNMVALEDDGTFEADFGTAADPTSSGGLDGPAALPDEEEQELTPNGSFVLDATTKRRIADGEITEMEAYFEKEQEREAKHAAKVAVDDTASPRDTRRARKEAKKNTGKPVVAAPTTREDSSDDDLVVIEHVVDDAKREEVATKLARFTSLVDVFVRDFTIIPNKHIEYNLSVSLCGFSWVVSKRYTAFEALNKQICSHYKMAEKTLPDIKDAFATRWSKLEEDTGRMRQAFFTAYLRCLVENIDAWKPHNHTVPLELTKRDPGQRRSTFLGIDLNDDEAEAFANDDGKPIKVFINKYVYEFLCFAEHKDDFSADAAQAAIEEKKESLPTEFRRDMEERRQEDLRSTKKANFDARRKQFAGLRTAELEEFAEILGSFDDDREAIRRAKHFVRTGYYTTEHPRAVHLKLLQSRNDGAASFRGTGNALGGGAFSASNSSVFELSSQNSMRAFHHSSLPPDQLDPSLQKPCGLRSDQLVILVRALSFDDTKHELVRVLSRVLCDDKHLDDVYAEVIYDWDRLAEEVQELLGYPDQA